MKKQAEQWLLFARTDLITTRQILENEELTSIVAFHSHQCAEKSFKALLELFDQSIPRIHDLRKLFKNISDINIELSIDHDTLDKLNQVYIDTRYPADYGIQSDWKPSIEKAKLFQNFADKVYKQADNILKNFTENKREE